MAFTRKNQQVRKYASGGGFDPNTFLSMFSSAGTNATGGANGNLMGASIQAQQQGSKVLGGINPQQAVMGGLSGAAFSKAKMEQEKANQGFRSSSNSEGAINAIGGVATALPGVNGKIAKYGNMAGELVGQVWKDRNAGEGVTMRSDGEAAAVNAIKGASTGVAIGNQFGGPLGAAIGGGIGLVGGGVSGLLSANKEQERAALEVKKRINNNITNANQMAAAGYGAQPLMAQGGAIFRPSQRKFANGGGITTPNKPATRQDSLDLYNNSKSVMGYYEKKGYQTAGKSKLPAGKNYFKDIDKAHSQVVARSNYVKSHPYIENEGTYRGVKPIVTHWIDNQKQAHTRVPKPSNPNEIQYEAINPAIYRTTKDAQRFSQREYSNETLDTRAPKQLYHRAVQPTMMAVYDNTNPNNALYKDRAEIHTYDPISVKPWQMMSLAEKALRVSKYGVPDGVKYNAPVPAASRKVPAFTGAASPDPYGNLYTDEHNKRGVYNGAKDFASGTPLSVGPGNPYPYPVRKTGDTYYADIPPVSPVPAISQQAPQPLGKPIGALPQNMPIGGQQVSAPQTPITATGHRTIQIDSKDERLRGNSNLGYSTFKVKSAPLTEHGARTKARLAKRGYGEGGTIPVFRKGGAVILGGQLHEQGGELGKGNPITKGKEKVAETEREELMLDIANTKSILALVKKYDNERDENCIEQIGALMERIIKDETIDHSGTYDNGQEE